MNVNETEENAVMEEPELVSACNNPNSRTISPALKDCYDRWSQKS